MANAIEIKNLSKTFMLPHEKVKSLKETIIKILKGRFSYEKFFALKNINVNIKKGEFIGIIGRNGSGKSTLLKMIEGIYIPTSGKVHSTGRISPFLELEIGFGEDLTAKDNVYRSAAVLGMTKKEIDSKYEKIVKFSELERFMDAMLKTFSSGMQVRLGFATAIQVDADIYLVDEVLAVGDSGFQKKCFEVFKKLKKKKKTIVFVSHDLDTVKEFCDRVVWIENGEIIAEGKANKIIKKYLEHGKKSIKKKK